MKRNTKRKIEHFIQWSFFSNLAIKLWASAVSFNNRKCDYSHDVIFIKLDNIGDFVIWLGTAKEFREYYKDKKIAVICNPKNKDLAEKSGCFDEVIPFSRNLFELKGIKVHKLINPTNSKTIIDESVAIAVSADEKIATVDNNANKYKSTKILFNPSKIYDRIIKTNDAPIPEIERYQRFCNKITGSDNKACFADLSNYNDCYSVNENYFVVNLGANQALRTWPAERFAKLAENVNKNNLLCVLVGSPSEKVLEPEFVSNYKGKYLSLIGKTTIPEMISVISKAEFVLSNDTSTVHISAACNTKCFCIAPGYFYPRFTSYPSSLFEEERSIPQFVTGCNDCKGCLNNIGIEMKSVCKRNYRDNKLIECVDKVNVQMATDAALKYLD